MKLKIESGVIIGIYKTDVHITLDMAKEIVATRLLLTDKMKMPCLIMSSGAVSMDKKAKKFLASGEGIRGLTALAICVKSVYDSLVGNFFIRVSKTKIPVRLFTSVTIAKKWLETFTNKN